ncbi:MAG: helix-turn-helix domain-containing protein [Planctomycetota bacterium]
MPESCQDKNIEKVVDFYSFGERVRHARKQVKLNQTELAEKIGGTTHATISNIEKGKVNPSIEITAKIAHALNLDLHWLITGQSSPTSQEIHKILRPFATVHLSGIMRQIQDLEKERQQLESLPLTERAIAISRLYEIQDELETHHLHYKVMFDRISEADKFIKPSQEPDKTKT